MSKHGAAIDSAPTPRADASSDEAASETLERYERESSLRDGLPRPWMVFIACACVALALFHLYTAYAGPFVDVIQRSIHLYTILGLAFIFFPIVRSGARDRVPWLDVLLVLAAFAVGCYMLATSHRIIVSAGRINNVDLAVGVLALLLVLDATRRVTGWGLTVLASVFLVYGFYAKFSLYPTLNTTVAMALSRQVVSHLVFITEGLLGTAIAVSASYIILFILFGAFMVKSGLGRLFNDLALTIAGPTRGGPAKVSVVASGFLGSINGSAIANVVTTGAFTIPLMKRTGYHRNFAGAVEAASSVGGQIMPPIMGAAAFIMAQILSVPYTQVMLAGIIPALLFYFGILCQVHLRALRNGLSGISRAELTPLKAVMLRRGHLLIPLIVLLWMIFEGRAPFFAAFWSIAVTVLICGTPALVAGLAAVLVALLFQPQLMALVYGYAVPEMPAGRGWLFGVIALPIVVNLIRSRLAQRSDQRAETIALRDCRDAMIDGVRNAVPVAIACAAVGIITGVATLTGIALDAADWVVGLASTIPFEFLQLALTLVLTMAAAIALGMGLPSIPCYIITSTMAAPILLHLPLFRELAGSSDTAVFTAHMFVFYFGVFANLTPPVALAAYAGAGVSGGSPNATGVQALKLGVAGFVVPYMFVFAHSMLMLDATWISVVIVAVTGVLGVGLLSIAVEGFLRGHLNPAWRILAAAGALGLIYPSWISDALGVAIAALLFFATGSSAAVAGRDQGPARS